MSPREIVDLDAVSLSRAIKSKQLSCVEVMNAHLDQIERLNPRVCSRRHARDMDALTAFNDPRLPTTDLISAKEIPAAGWAAAHLFLSAKHSSHF